MRTINLHYLHHEKNHKEKTDTRVCPQCKSMMIPDIFSSGMVRNGEELNVFGIHGYVCTKCGEKFFDEEEAALIDHAAREITLMEAICRMSAYKNKKKPLMFTVTFDDNPARAARFAKVWRKVEKCWMYSVQDGPYVPGFLYNEREAVSAIMSIKGMNLIGASVKYHIHQVEE